MIGELFDPLSELVIDEHYRPHWSQAGAIVFVTFRTKDSIPRSVLERWHREKVEWLESKGVDLRSYDGNFELAVAGLSQEDVNAFRKEFNRKREMCLDECHGRCLLRRSEFAMIVADSLMHFDRERYRMGDFIVMPNHVHLLVAFRTSEQMRRQFNSWLHWTATKINRAVGSSGHFWQQEPFDHLVRSNEQYAYLRDYIRDNPKKANLSPGEYYYRRAD
ncbi:MAG: hypothetical protein NXI32_14590 [bacterium]|nr:hypothetical protein [bacterium]